MHVYIMCCTFVLFCFDYRDQVGVGGGGGDGGGGGWRRGEGVDEERRQREGVLGVLSVMYMYNPYGVTF